LTTVAGLGLGAILGSFHVAAHPTSQGWRPPQLTLKPLHGREPAEVMYPVGQKVVSGSALG
jgi:hypothetical protein